jgi:WD40 repeat protein
MRLLTGHSRKVTSLAFVPGRPLLATGSADQRVLLWDLTGSGPPTVLKGHRAYVHALAAAPDGSVLASGSGDRTIRVWDLPYGNPQKVLAGHSGPVTRLAFAPDGRLLVSGAFGDGGRYLGEALLWVPAAWREPPVGSFELTWAAQVHLLSPAAGEFLGLCQPPHPVWALAYAPNGRRLFVAGRRTGHLWDPTAWALVTNWDSDRAIRGAAFSPDGRLLALALMREVVFDTSTATDRGPTRFVRLSHPGKGISATAFSPDGRVLATAGENGEVRLWDVAGVLAQAHPRRSVLVERPQTVRAVGLGKLHDLAYSPDGLTLAAAGDRGVLIWDVDEG